MLLRAPDVLVAVSALQILLRRREYRPIFHAEEGVKLYARAPLSSLYVVALARANDCH